MFRALGTLTILALQIIQKRVTIGVRHMLRSHVHACSNQKLPDSREDIVESDSWLRNRVEVKRKSGEKQVVDKLESVGEELSDDEDERNNEIELEFD